MLPSNSTGVKERRRDAASSIAAAAVEALAQLGDCGELNVVEVEVGGLGRSASHEQVEASVSDSDGTGDRVSPLTISGLDSSQHGDGGARSGDVFHRVGGRERRCSQLSTISSRR